MDTDSRLFHERLLRTLQKPLLKDGQYTPIDVRQAGPDDRTNDAMVAGAWLGRRAADPRLVLTVSNLAPTKGYARIPLPADRFDAARKYRVIDRLDGRAYERDGAELVGPGLFVALDGHQAHLLEIYDSETAE